MTDNDITVHVRSPSLHDTLSIQISLYADINTLMASIESAHPKHPSTLQQRIIYSGKILQNTDKLEEIFKNAEKDFIPTFHLVLKPTLHAEQQRQPETSRVQVEPIVQQPQSQPQQQQMPIETPLLPGGYQVVFINGQYYLAPVLVPSGTFDLYQQQQQINLQQPTQQPAQQPIQQLVQQQPAVQPAVQQPIIQQQADRVVVQHRRPIFGGMNGIVNNIQRTTSIWLAVRLMITLFIVCQGASIERMIIYHIIAFFFFLYQTNRLRPVIARINQWRPAPQPPTTAPVTTLGVVKRFTFAFFASLWPTYGLNPPQ